MPLKTANAAPLEKKNPSFTFDGLLDSTLNYSAIESPRQENVPQTIRERFAPGVSRHTAFSILSKGGLADRFFIDVDYRKDDRNAEADEDSRLLMRYQGKKGELLQAIELGDTSLELPGARWLSLKGKSGKISRQSFAGKSTFAYHDIEMTLIASHQKGKPETENFDLGSSVQRTAIRDIDFIQKRFFAVAPPSDLPLDPLSVTIFYDDGNGFNNTALTQKFTPTGSQKQGDYDSLTPEDPSKGYELDPRTGIVHFLFDIPFNASLVVSYRTAFNKQVMKQLFKSDDDSMTSELKNRYALPENFLELSEIALEDSSGKRISPPAFSIDPLRKVIVFDSTQPFAAAVYQFPPSHSQTILLSYRAASDKASVTLSKEPIPESLKVELNGRPLTEGNDYTVAGGARTILTLYGTKPNDHLSVSYNAKDFPQTRQTAGGALTIGKDHPFTAGVSALYDFAPSPTHAPKIGGDNASIRMIGASLKGKEKIGKSEINLELEAAGSEYNPNPYGASIVDNMDDIRRALPIEARESFWKPSSKPLSAAGSRSKNPITFGSVFLREMIPSSFSDQKESFLAFSSDSGEWSGVERALAPQKGSVDLRPYRSLEMFVFSEGSGKLTVEWGDVSEDINGNGRLDTEDANHDGLVDSSEDSGLFLENGTLYGTRNNLLDTEDLDMDGKLNLTESTRQESIDLNWMGWKKLSFPLKDAVSARFLRLWTAGNAKVRIAKMEFVGLDYSEEKSAGAEISIAAVSSQLDPDAPMMIEHPVFKRLYPDRFDSLNRNALEDFAIRMDYTLAPSGEVAARKEIHADLTDQNQIHFFAASTAPANAVLFLRLGSKTDYFEFTVAVSQLSSQYREFSVRKERFRAVGSPSWQNLSEIRIGLFNPASIGQSGRIFFNELFVDQPVIRKAVAFSAVSEFSYPFDRLNDTASIFLGKNGRLFLSGELTSVPENFRTPDETIQGQQRRKILGGWNSESALLQYSAEEEFIPQTVKQSGTQKIFSSPYFSKSDKMEWNLKPKFYTNETVFSGSFEKKEKNDLHLKEKMEAAVSQIQYSNPTMADWIPKRCLIDSSYRRDLAFQKDTIGGSVEPRWSAWDGNLSLSPRIEMEETVLSSANFIASLKRSASLTGNGSVPLPGLSPIQIETKAASENSIQRIDFPSLNFLDRIQSSLNYDGNLYGKSSAVGTLSETKVFTSSPALIDPYIVLKFQPPKSNAEQFHQSREFTLAQENVRLLAILDVPEWDWFGFSVRSALREETKRFLNVPYREHFLKFPDGTLVFSTGEWTCSAGGSLEQMRSADQSAQTENIQGEIGFRKKIWEMKQTIASKNKIQKRSESASQGSAKEVLLSKLQTISFIALAKAKLEEPFYQFVKPMRKNFFLQNRIEMSLTLDIESKKGEQFGNQIDEITSKLTHRTDYFVRDSLKIYVAFDGWRYRNRIASSANYTAYSVTGGLHSTF